MRLLLRSSRATLAALGLAVCTAALFSACASSSGAKCDDKAAPSPVVCPECPQVRPAGRAAKVPREALGMERPRKIQLVSFTADGSRALIRVEDATSGSYFQTLQLVGEAMAPKVDKTHMFDRATESTVKAQAMKGFKAHPGPPSQVNADGVSLLAADRGDAVVIYALKGERAVPVIELPRLVDADGRASDVTMVKLAWDPTGARALIIHRQTLAADLGFASDWVHVVAVPASELPFGP
jgi:hypothetical protein